MRSTVLYRAAATLVLLACALHVAGVLFDMTLEGRLPMTNAYSSIILAGLGLMPFGVAVERFARNGIGILAAALAGLVTITIAHSLAPGGALALWRAALDENFWIAAIASMIACGFGRRALTTTARSVTGSPVGPARKAARWRLGRLWHVRPSF